MLNKTKCKCNGNLFCLLLYDHLIALKLCMHSHTVFYKYVVWYSEFIILAHEFECNVVLNPYCTYVFEYNIKQLYVGEVYGISAGH